jgi:DHA3 family macrolide efflux protein-like MFS transporter
MTPRVFAPLAHPPIARLWGALAVAAIGDELFKVAMVWLAVQAIGADASYLSAVSSLTMLVAAALGGRFLDARDPRAVMSVASSLRMLGAALPVIAVLAGASVILGLVLATFMLALLRAQFDPAVQASLPRLARNQQELLAANGLADGTVRLARLVGPALAGPLAAIVPILHFFTLDAALLAFAWLLILALPRLPPVESTGGAGRGILASVALVRRSVALRTMFLASMVMNCCWVTVITFGLALLIQERAPTLFGVGGIGAYSLMISFYGLVNVVANLTTASRGAPPSYALALAGQSLGALGFVAMGLIAGAGDAQPWLLPGLTLAACLVAIGGPAYDLRMLTTVQATGSSAAVSGVFRIRLVTQHLGLLAGTLIAPTLLRELGVPATMLAMGGLLVAANALAWMAMRRQPPG